MPITVAGIDPGTLTNDNLNAFNLLNDMTDEQFAAVKAQLNLPLPLVLGPQTLAEFMSLCASRGVTLSDMGGWKAAHGLSNGALIGKDTATAVFAAVTADVAPAVIGLRPINQAGINLIKSFEGLSLNAYLDSVRVPTIGFGHTDGVRIGQTITELQAEQFLQDDLSNARRDVTRLVHVPLTDNQFAALVSIAFNVGPGCLIDTHLATDLAAKDYTAAADDFLRFNRAGGNVLAGLTRRREAERNLFLTA